MCVKVSNGFFKNCFLPEKNLIIFSGKKPVKTFTCNLLATGQVQCILFDRKIILLFHSYHNCLHDSKVFLKAFSAPLLLVGQGKCKG